VDLQYWRYMEETHPVYDRPPDVEAWPFAQPLPVRGGHELLPDPYREAEEAEAAGLIDEPLHMSIEGLPRLDWYQNAAGHTVLTLRLFSAYAEDMDVSEVVAAARTMFEDFKLHSRGPLTRADLRDLEHPYGYGTPDEPQSWARLQAPRKVPRYPVVKRREGLRRVSLGHVRGIRGSVATMAVVNRDTGKFERDWRWTYTVSGAGVTLTFWNERVSETGAPVAWFLAHGTIWMQTAPGRWCRRGTGLRWCRRGGRRRCARRWPADVTRVSTEWRQFNEQTTVDAGRDEGDVRPPGEGLRCEQASEVSEGSAGGREVHAEG